MTTRVAPGRSRRTALKVSIAPTTRSGGGTPGEADVEDRVRPGVDRGVGAWRRPRSARAPRPGTGGLVVLVGSRGDARRLRVGRDGLGRRDRRQRGARPQAPGRPTAPPPRRGETKGTTGRVGAGDLPPTGDRRPPAPGRPPRAAVRRSRTPLPAAVAVAVAGRSGSAPAARPRSPAATSRANASGPGRGGVVPVDREVGQQRDLLAPVVDPPGDQQDRAVAPGRDRLLVQPREDDDLDACPGGPRG